MPAPFSALPTWPDEGATFDGILHTAPFFEWCARQKVSDITIQSDQRVVVERHGRFFPVTKRVLSPNEVEDVLVKLYDGEVAKAIIQKGKAIDCAYEIRPTRNEFLRFRINATPIYGGLQITARTIEDTPPSFVDDLRVEQEIVDNFMPSSGLVLVTGATGSGKTTLLAAGIRYILEGIDNHKKIITFEAPIEFVYNRVQRGPSPMPGQTEIGEGRMLPNWPEAIKNALRRAPDIILLGEARDLETLSGVIEASQTGHTVYSTVHSENFAQTIRRMISLFPAAEKNARANDIIGALRMVISQKLVPSTDGGRVALREYVVFNNDVVEMLLNGPGGLDNIFANSWAVLAKYGQSFVQDAQKKLEEGRISEATFREIARMLDAESRDALVAEGLAARERMGDIRREEAAARASEGSGGLFSELLEDLGRELPND
jgi:defect in organelle trafficking protein DotB